MAILRRAQTILEQSFVPPVEGDPPLPGAPEGAPIIRRGLRANWLTRILDGQDRRPELRERDAMGDGYLHVSQLAGLCPRAWVLANLFNINSIQSATGGHRVMWKIGKAVEHMVRTSFIANQGRSNIYGRWTCVCGASESQGFYDRDARCDTCHNGLTLYREAVLRDDEYKIKGSPDFAVMVEGRLIVVEVKSMTGDDFDALEEPSGNYKQQALLYRWLFERAGFPVHDSVVLIYVTKKFKWGSPYKEFHVNANDSTSQLIVDTALQIAMEAKTKLDGRTIPERTLCENPEKRRAKDCKCVGMCFNLPTEEHQHAN